MTRTVFIFYRWKYEETDAFHLLARGPKEITDQILLILRENRPHPNLSFGWKFCDGADDLRNGWRRQAPYLKKIPTLNRILRMLERVEHQSTFGLTYQ